ncbi:hypothetical protein AB0K05_27475 [Nonomuraea sp. NPDC049486]|uniref:acyltransferase n=1 Tax=Nonomuraea sp. NPDC049486 TaxID=3155773 RepID=UPI00344730FE
MGTTALDGDAPFARHHHDYSPWSFWDEAGQEEQDRQLELQRALTGRHAGYEFGERCFVSELASVQNEELRLGPRTYVAAGAYLSGSVRTGRDCSMNPYTVVRGDVRLGDAVRIGAHTSLLGFNHTMSDPDVEVFRQPLTSRGIEIGDDVWIGSHVVVLDGVTVRAQCDAIEIADLLLGRAPGPMPADEQADRLRSWQDPATGLVGTLLADGSQRRPDPGLAETPDGGPRPQPGLSDPDVGYHVLCVGYALDLLGSRFPAPVRPVADMEAGDLIAFLESLPWTRDAWGAGHWVDILGTAMLWNGGRGRPGATEALFGWLVTHADPDTGMWGSARPIDGLLRIVNGFYRASRGTFAQFGVPLPYPERVVDTVLRHARDPRYVRPERQNACDILDIAHPLWLTRHTGYRAEEVTALARTLLSDALGHWTDGQGFGFQAPHPTTAGVAATVPGLQGTEMWLAILWLLSDLAGVADALAYRPRGVHRPEPAVERPRTA